MPPTGKSPDRVDRVTELRAATLGLQGRRYLCAYGCDYGQRGFRKFFSKRKSRSRVRCDQRANAVNAHRTIKPIRSEPRGTSSAASAPTSPSPTATSHARADLEALVEISPVGVLECDATRGRPLSVNREARRIIARSACPPPPSWSPGASPPTRPDPTGDTAPGCRSGGTRARLRSRGSHPACGVKGRDSPPRALYRRIRSRRCSCRPPFRLPNAPALPCRRVGPAAATATPCRETTQADAANVGGAAWVFKGDG